MGSLLHIKYVGVMAFGDAQDNSECRLLLHNTVAHEGSYLHTDQNLCLAASISSDH